VGRACYAGYLIRATADPAKLDPEFLYLFTKSAAYADWKSMVFIKATIENIGADKYSNLPIPVPPTLAEQEAIVRKVREGNRRFDELRTKVESVIALLRERRTALIAAAVTGRLPITA